MLQLSGEASSESSKASEDSDAEMEAFVNINEEITSANDYIMDFQSDTKNVDTYASDYNNNKWRLDKAKEHLEDAYDLCGSYKNLSTLKAYIKTTINDFPSETSISDNDVVNTLNKMNDLLSDMKDVFEEIIEISSKYE